MPIQIGQIPRKSVKVVAELPKAIVSAGTTERNGVAGIEVVTFYPLPEENQIEVTERKGKNTLKTNDKGETTGVDNSGAIVSVLSVFGRAAKVDLSYVAKNENGEDEEFSLVDPNGNVFQVSSKLFTRVKGEGAEDEDDTDAE